MIERVTALVADENLVDDADQRIGSGRTRRNELRGMTSWLVVAEVMISAMLGIRAVPTDSADAALHEVLVHCALAIRGLDRAVDLILVPLVHVERKTDAAGDRFLFGHIASKELTRPYSTIKNSARGGVFV